MGDLQLCLVISFIVKQFSCRNRSKDTEIVDALIRGVLACERQQQWGSLHQLRVQGRWPILISIALFALVMS